MFLTQIINGQVTTVNLCDSCSKEKGVTDTTGFGLAEAFLSPGSTKSALEDLTCPSCGFTQAQLKKIGRMGCPECYTTFRDGLDSLLSAMHKGTKHVGKVPTGKAVSQAEIKRLITQHRDELQKAVKDERYEEAARLKAELDSLQTRLE